MAQGRPRSRARSSSVRSDIGCSSVDTGEHGLLCLENQPSQSAATGLSHWTGSDRFG
jgi:hypothetical protein